MEKMEYAAIQAKQSNNLQGNAKTQEAAQTTNYELEYDVWISTKSGTGVPDSLCQISAKVYELWFF